MVKTHDVVEMLDQAFNNILKDKESDCEIIMCETARTDKAGELLVTFTNNDLSENKYIINISLKE